MKDKKFITTGDRVEVSWERIERLEGILTHIAFDEGMTSAEYTIKSDDGRLHQVSTYCKMSIKNESQF